MDTNALFAVSLLSVLSCLCYYVMLAANYASAINKNPIGESDEVEGGKFDKKVDKIIEGDMGGFGAATYLTVLSGKAHKNYESKRGKVIDEDKFYELLQAYLDDGDYAVYKKGLADNSTDATTAEPSGGNDSSSSPEPSGGNDSSSSPEPSGGGEDVSSTSTLPSDLIKTEEDFTEMCSDSLIHYNSDVLKDPDVIDLLGLQKGTYPIGVCADETGNKLSQQFSYIEVKDHETLDEGYYPRSSGPDGGESSTSTSTASQTTSTSTAGESTVEDIKLNIKNEWIKIKDLFVAENISNGTIYFSIDSGGRFINKISAVTIDDSKNIRFKIGSRDTNYYLYKLGTGSRSGTGSTSGIYIGEYRGSKNDKTINNVKADSNLIRTSAQTAAPEPTYSYVTGNWGNCSDSCGGTRVRSVTCKKNGTEEVADSYCSGTKPVGSESCNMNACTDNLIEFTKNGVHIKDENNISFSFVQLPNGNLVKSNSNNDKFKFEGENNVIKIKNITKNSYLKYETSTNTYLKGVSGWYNGDKFNVDTFKKINENLYVVNIHVRGNRNKKVTFHIEKEQPTTTSTSTAAPTTAAATTVEDITNKAFFYMVRGFIFIASNEISANVTSTPLKQLVLMKKTNRIFPISNLWATSNDYLSDQEENIKGGVLAIKQLTKQIEGDKMYLRVKFLNDKTGYLYINKSGWNYILKYSNLKVRFDKEYIKVQSTTTSVQTTSTSTAAPTTRINKVKKGTEADAGRVYYGMPNRDSKLNGIGDLHKFSPADGQNNIDGCVSKLNSAITDSDKTYAYIGYRDSGWRDSNFRNTCYAYYKMDNSNSLSLKSVNPGYKHNTPNHSMFKLVPD